MAEEAWNEANPMKDGTPVAEKIVRDDGIELGNKDNIFQGIVVAVVAANNADGFFGPLDNITIQQTKRGCIQECFGCEAQSEYRIYPGEVEQGKKRDQSIPQIGHLLEESGFCVRLCCAEMRPFNMPLTVGKPEAKNGPFGPTVVNYVKPWTFPICCTLNLQALAIVPVPGVPLLAGNYNVPCCCALPKINTVNSDGAVLGSTEYLCDVFLAVPKFLVRDERATPQYLVRPDTCCFGCCIVCKCGGRGARSVYVPFYIRDPETKEPVNAAGNGDEKAMINKVWSGFKKECCTDADNFFVRFPKGASPATKANLVGANLLVDFTYFEK